MPTPTSRSKILPARGSKANLDTALTAGDLLEGELCYAKDEDALYQVEGGVLIKAGGGVPEAPIDGNQYARQDASWSLVAPGGIEEAPQDGGYYVRQNGQWINLTDALYAIDDKVIDGGDLETGTSTGDDTVVDGGVIT